MKNQNFFGRVFSSLRKKKLSHYYHRVNYICTRFQISLVVIFTYVRDHSTLFLYSVHSRLFALQRPEEQERVHVGQ